MLSRFPRFQKFALKGPIVWRARSLLQFAISLGCVTVRRLARGPLLASWTYELELATHFFKAQGIAAFRAASAGKVDTCRQVIDSLTFQLPALASVHIVVEHAAPMPGKWFIARRPGPTALYFHGGGYAFYPAMTDNLAAAVSAAIGGRTFVPQYRLAPEHPFPAQLDDGLRSYRWLLEQGVMPSQLVVIGDSAGGHLALSVLLALHDAGLPSPAAGIAISPWVDPSNSGDSMQANGSFDWMTRDMADQLGKWAGAAGGSEHPLFWPMQADLKALPPVLVQSGGAEIFRDMIEDFRVRAEDAGANVAFETWPDMNHNFQGFGSLLGESGQALDRMASFVAARCALAN